MSVVGCVSLNWHCTDSCCSSLLQPKPTVHPASGVRYKSALWHFITISVLTLSLSFIYEKVCHNFQTWANKFLKLTITPVASSWLLCCEVRRLSGSNCAFNKSEFKLKTFPPEGFYLKPHAASITQCQAAFSELKPTDSSLRAYSSTCGGSDRELVRARQISATQNNNLGNWNGEKEDEETIWLFYARGRNSLHRLSRNCCYKINHYTKWVWTTDHWVHTLCAWAL